MAFNRLGTDFTNLNDFIQTPSVAVSRFIFGHFERSDGIFHQNPCILDRKQPFLALFLGLETDLVIVIISAILLQKYVCV